MWRQGLRLGISLIIGLPSALFAIDSVKLTADHLVYDEDKRQVVASSNVHMRYQGVEVETDALILDVDAETVSGTGNVVIHRDGNTLESGSFFFDLNNDLVTVRNVNTTIRPNEVATGNLYIRADELTDKPGHKSGKGGLVTSCELDEPHYYIKAKQFDYYPDKRIIGRNVLIYAPLWFVPFGFWSPYYVYELGSRKMILLVPQVGKNDVMGFFVQNTLDYAITGSQTGNIYIDYMEKKGLGLGITHRYEFGDWLSGSVYYYGNNDKEGDKNRKVKVDQSYQLSDPLTLSWMYEDIDTFRIPSGRREEINKSVHLFYDELGNIHDTKLSESQNLIQDTRTLNFDYTKTWNGHRDFKLTFKKNITTAQTKDDLTVDQALRFPAGFTWNNNLVYNKTERDNLAAPDEHLNPKTVLTKTFDNPNNKLTLTIDTTLDPDGDTVTQDQRIFLEKKPELKANFSQPFTFNNLVASENISIQFSEELTAGHYNEQQRTQSGNLRTFDAGKLSASQKAKLTVSKLPLQSTFGYDFDYDQAFYTPGDRLFTVRHAYRLDSDWWSFIKFHVNYTNKYSGGNSPFITDGLNSQREEILKHKLTFYYKNVNQYKWENQIGWNWVTDKPVDYTTELNINPNPSFKMNLKSGYRFPKNRLDNPDNKYYDLIGKLTVSTQNVTLTADITHDLNTGELKRLENGIKIKVGSRWQSRWELNARFQYRPGEDVYKLDSVSFTKDLHRRELTLSYSEPLEEYKLTYTILAFPSDKISVSRDENEAFKFEGSAINDNEQNRF